MRFRLQELVGRVLRRTSRLELALHSAVYCRCTYECKNDFEMELAEKFERMFRLGYSAQTVGGALRRRTAGTCIT